MNINSEYHHKVLDKATQCFGAKSDAVPSRLIELKIILTIAKNRKNKTIPYSSIIKTVVENKDDIDLNYVFLTLKNLNVAALDAI